MSKKTSSEGKNPGSLDFIENALNENTKDLKDIAQKIESLNCKLSNKGEPSNLKSIENSLGILEERFNSINKILSSQTEKNQNSNFPKRQEKEDPVQHQNCTCAPILMKCKNWDEFLICAASAEKVSVAYRESDKMFEVDALKENQIVAYVGPLPKMALLLKGYLSMNLSVASENVFEGALS